MKTTARTPSGPATPSKRGATAAATPVAASMPSGTANGKAMRSTRGDTRSIAKHVEDSGSDSDAEDDGDDNEDDDDDDEEDYEDDNDDQDDDDDGEEDDDNEDDSEDDNSDANDSSDLDSAGLVPGAAPLSTKKVIKGKDLVDFTAKLKKSGVVYMSRVPPHMKPAKVRHLMSQYGDVGRIFLQPEDPQARKRRVGSGGNKKKNFSEGWIEFADKKIAKRVAEALNGTIIGGKKSSFYHDDLWLLKYLKKFKWHHLREQLAYENAVREQKLRAELAQSKRENAFFLENVNKSKMIREMEARKQSKRLATEMDDDSSAASGGKTKKPRQDAGTVSSTIPATAVSGSKASRVFKQKTLLPDPEERDTSIHPSVLRKVFGSSE